MRYINDYINIYINETKSTINEYRYFLESNFVRVNRSFALIDLNKTM